MNKPNSGHSDGHRGKVVTIATRWLGAQWSRLTARLHDGTSPAPRPGILRGPRLIALTAIAILVATASGAAFAESYRGLYEWAGHHDLSGFWQAAFPLTVDVFIAVGELTLFVALIDVWRTRDRLGAWLLTLAGLAVSVAGNIGHVASHRITDRGTAAIPPLAAAAALAVGLGVLKRVVAARQAQVTPAKSKSRPAPVPSGKLDAARMTLEETVKATNPLSQRQLVQRFGITQTEAGNLHRELVPTAPLNGDGPHA